MTLKWGSTTVTAVKWGNTNCTAVYWGSTKVWPTESPDMDAYINSTGTTWPGYDINTKLFNSNSIESINADSNVTIINCLGVGSMIDCRGEGVVKGVTLYLNSPTQIHISWDKLPTNPGLRVWVTLKDSANDYTKEVMLLRNW